MQVEFGSELFAAHAEVGIAAWCGVGDSVEDHLAIERQTCAAKFHHADGVRARLRWCVCGGCAERHRATRQAGVKARQQQHLAIGRRGAVYNVALTAGASEHLDVEAATVGGGEEVRGKRCDGAIDIAAGFVDDGHLIAEAFLQGLERSDAVVRLQRRRAAAHDSRALGVGSNDSKCAHVGNLQWQHTVVLQEHHRLGGGLSGELAVLGAIDSNGRAGLVVEGTDAVEHRQQALCCAIEQGLIDEAFAHGIAKLAAVEPSGSGHLKIEACVGSASGSATSKPVGNDEPVEAPFAAQDVVQ